MTEDQATALRKRLLAHRARLLDHAVQQVEAVPPSWDWLSMLGNVQSALMALDETTGEPAP
jgi:hypothetical protein